MVIRSVKMKKYRKIIIKKIFDHNRHVASEDSSEFNDYFLQAVHWALDEFYYGSYNEDYLIKSLHDPDFDILGGNEGFIQKVENMVELYTPEDDLFVEPGDIPIPSAIVSIENLKVLAQDWKEFYERHAPVIYLIVEDNGWVTLRERLEE